MPATKNQAGAKEGKVGLWKGSPSCRQFGCAVQGLRALDCGSGGGVAFQVACATPKVIPLMRKNEGQD